MKKPVNYSKTSTPLPNRRVLMDLVGSGKKITDYSKVTPTSLKARSLIRIKTR